jgi:adenylate kinase family enzyme
MKQVFIINGAPTAGKDTFCEKVVNVAKQHNIFAKSISSVDRVKQICADMGWAGAKNEEDRNFLAEVKFSWKKYNNGPLKDMLSKALSNEYDILFVHIRELDEIDELKRLLNSSIHSVTQERIYCSTMYVKRDVNSNSTSKHSNEADAQAMSENAYAYDVIVDNNGALDDLSLYAETFVREMTVLAQMS